MKMISWSKEQSGHFNYLYKNLAICWFSNQHNHGSKEINNVPSTSGKAYSHNLRVEPHAFSSSGRWLSGDSCAVVSSSKRELLTQALKQPYSPGYRNSCDCAREIREIKSNHLPLSQPLDQYALEGCVWRNFAHLLSNDMFSPLSSYVIATMTIRTEP